MDGNDGRETRLFPDKKTDGNITCFGLTADFLIYGTDVSDKFPSANRNSLNQLHSFSFALYYFIYLPSLF